MLGSCPRPAGLHTGDAAQLVTAEQASELLGLPAEQVYAWINQRLVPYVRTGRGPDEQRLIPLQGMLCVLGDIKEVADGLALLDKQMQVTKLTEDRLRELAMSDG